MLLKDKIAIVTGGAKGMGAAICEKFAEEGAGVVVADLDYDSAQNVANHINTKGGRARAYHQADVTDRASLKAVVDRTIEEFGKIDSLINCAGGVFGGNGTS